MEPDSGVSHLTRAQLAPRFPVHVTLRLRDGLPSLRARHEASVVRGSLHDAQGRFDLRIVHFTALPNHIHLLVETRDSELLARGIQGLCVRLAKRLNKDWNRRGKVFADRYHTRILRSPREVRNALAYVLNNARRHGIRCASPDPHSSDRSFDGWIEPHHPVDDSVCARPRTWLLGRGWRRHGRISLRERPGPLRD